MDTIKLSLDIINTSTFHNMGIELWVDKNKFFDNNISPGRHHVIHSFDCEEGEHNLKIVLKGKTFDHTTIDADGKIVSDALISIENISLDEINIEGISQTLAEYMHDCNGTQTIAVHPFFGHLGCNGHVQMKFSSPVYLWMLENL